MGFDEIAVVQKGSHIDTRQVQVSHRVRPIISTEMACGVILAPIAAKSQGRGNRCNQCNEIDCLCQFLTWYAFSARENKTSPCPLPSCRRLADFYALHYFSLHPFISSSLELRYRRKGPLAPTWFDTIKGCWPYHPDHTLPRYLVLRPSRALDIT